MTEEPSPEIQEKMKEFYEMQQQARMVLAQKYQVELQLKEAEGALSELESAEGKAEVHKVVGQILIKSNKDAVSKELKEKKDNLEVRLKSITSQEKKFTDQMKSLQDRLQGVIPGSEPAKSE
jgi:prefoldin beta subunit|tara:strand:- start:11503 stop:11868 length:366 start_codon:yes stop_codon:yes gene_type:complete